MASSVPDAARVIRLARIPDGLPRESDFALDALPRPSCPPGGLLVRTLYLSVDPYLRGRIAGKQTYIAPILTGSPMESSAVGEVVESANPAFQAGDVVAGFWPWQDYVAIAASKVFRVDATIAPVSAFIGILGVPGLTAYFGLKEICQPKAGETVLVTGAGGAVGSAVGQIAKILGCRVVGTAGSETKVAWLRELGFDGAINYRTDKPYGDVLDRHCPQGIDCLFENVGGEMTDAIIPRMNFHGRIAVCGNISQYNDRSADYGPRPWHDIIVKQLRVEGFIVSRWMERFPEARKQMAAWLGEGKLRYEETVTEGLENAPRAFIGLFHGENTGKALVKL